MIQRPAHLNALKRLVSHHPVVALVGARQVGKTTLARELAWSRKGLTHFFDLESTADLARLADPLLALSPLRGLVVLDEVQRRPDLFPTLRVLSDRPHRPACLSCSRQCYFRATHSGAEIDLVVRQGTKLRGFEIKRTTAPAFTRSMRSALRDLNLSRIDLIHAGTESFALDKQVHAVAAQRLLRDIP